MFHLRWGRRGMNCGPRKAGTTLGFLYVFPESNARRLWSTFVVWCVSRAHGAIYSMSINKVYLE